MSHTAIRYVWIDRASDISPLLKEIENVPEIAVDTEADSYHHYHEKLCLVQLSFLKQTPSGNSEICTYLIDSLAGMDENILWESLRNKTLLLHGSNFDLRLLRRHRGFAPGRLFDTMIAAQLTGESEISYSALVNKYCGVKLNKTSQQEDWSRRPLTKAMLEYAVADTHYLMAVKQILQKRLEELSRLDWFEQSCQLAIRSAQGPDEKDDEETVWRITHSNSLSDFGRVVLREIWKWRESEAERADLSSFRIMNNQVVLKLVQQVCSKKDASELSDEMFPKFLKKQHRTESLLKTLQSVFLIPKDEWPGKILSRRPKVDRAAIQRAEDLKKRRDAIAASLKLDPTLIATRSTLEYLSRTPEPDFKTMVQEDKMLPWQVELLSQDLSSE